MISSDALARMRQQNIKEVNKDDLVDIRSVVVDTSLPPEQRMMDYLEKIKNPYCEIIRGHLCQLDRGERRGGQ